MALTTHSFDKRTGEYIQALALLRDDEVLSRLREETGALPDAQMQISIEQGQFMSLLVAAIRAKRCVEVGTFTGYSALCVAKCLPADGKLVACDVSEEWTSTARRYWQEAGVADRIDLRIGPASKTLARMIDAGEAGTYDFAFIDADKENYDDYYEKCLVLLRPGGVVALDNAFGHGRVIEPEPGNAAARVVHDLSRKIFKDPRVRPALVPISDGVLMAHKQC